MRALPCAATTFGGVNSRIRHYQSGATIPKCRFHTEPLEWNRRPFKLILDHIDGNSSDNRPEMLRFLCPNCDAQLPTRGGGNRGRIEKSSGGFAKISKDGKRHYVMPADPGYYAIRGSDTTGTTSQVVIPNPDADQHD